MRVLILNTDHDLFLEEFYARDPELSLASYEKQLRARTRSLFGVAGPYSRNLRALGHEAWELHASIHCLQAAWAREHSVALDPAVTDTPRWRSLLQSGRPDLAAAYQTTPAAVPPLAQRTKRLAL